MFFVRRFEFGRLFRILSISAVTGKILRKVPGTRPVHLSANVGGRHLDSYQGRAPGRLAWFGLGGGWFGVGWVRLGWVWLGWAGLDWNRFGSIGLEGLRVGLGWAGLDWVGLDWLRVGVRVAVGLSIQPSLVGNSCMQAYLVGVWYADVCE